MSGAASAPGADAGPSGWRAVLFDLDGTLADTIELILRCYRHTMRIHLGEAPPDERWLAGIGTPLRDQLKEFARDADEAARMAETYAAHQRAIHDDLVAPYPGAVEVTRAFKDRGVPVGVVTSRRSVMALRTLERCGLGSAYDVLVTADDVVRGKPDPEPVLMALDRLGLAGQAGRTLMVGDSPFDIRAGRDAGTRTAAALWGSCTREVLAAEAPDWLVSRLDEVLTLRP